MIATLPRASNLLTLKFGPPTEFDDPKLNYHRLFTELLIKFILAAKRPARPGTPSCDGT